MCSVFICANVAEGSRELFQSRFGCLCLVVYTCTYVFITGLYMCIATYIYNRANSCKYDPPDPMNHVKILEGQTRRFAF